MVKNEGGINPNNTAEAVAGTKNSAGQVETASY